LFEVFLLSFMIINAKFPMLPLLTNSEPDDAGNRDRHAGTDATGNSRTFFPHGHVPTRFSAWRSFPRKRRYRNRAIDSGGESIERPVFFGRRNLYTNSI
jgi:hypothetical protein